MNNKFTRLFTEPLIQFLIIGACIYGAYALFGASHEDIRDNVLHVDSKRINAYISEWRNRWNRPPTRREVDDLIQSYIREEVLYRQAVAMGLNEDDNITRRRMARKLEFLTSDLAMMKEPEPGELEQYFEQNEASYRRPDKITFTQVFLDPDVHEELTLADADELLALLQAAGAPDAHTLQAGDQTTLQSYFQATETSVVASQLGSGFVNSLMTLESGKWHGPVLSSHGVHLVYVYGHVAAPPAVFEDVREAVLENWRLEKRKQFNEDFLESLKSRYEIVIDAIPAERILSRPDETATVNDTMLAPAS